MTLIRSFSFFLLFILSSPSIAGIEIRNTDQPLIELIALVLGGIGLFLMGIHLAGSYFYKMTGGKFTQVVITLTNSLFGSLLSGIALGFVTQSGKACAFIVADFVQANMIKNRQAAFIVFFGNAGASLIALVSILDIKVFALILLGITGLGLTFKIPKSLIRAYGAIFGLAMIMLGLYFVKDGASGMGGLDWVTSLLSHELENYYMISFLIVFGFVLTLVFQSNIATNLIVIAFVSTGLLSIADGLATVIGAQASTGLMTYIYSFHAKGRARQVVMQQIAFDLVVTVFFLLLFLIEVIFHLPLLMALVERFVQDTGSEMLILVITTQFFGALLLTLLHRPVAHIIEHYFQPTSVEILSSTAFISDQSNVSLVETSLLLVEKEQMRLMQRLPDYIDYLRESHNGKVRKEQYSPKDFHQAYQIIAEKISDNLSKASSKQLTDGEASQLMTTTKLQEQLNHLEGIVFEFTETMQQTNVNTEAFELGKSIMESLDFMIMMAIDAVESNNEEEINMLSLLTKDRSQMMMKLRDNYFDSEYDFSQDDRNFILDVTILFENTVQALSRYGGLMKAFKQTRLY
jgi:phosphate:Na+ symporter